MGRLLPLRSESRPRPEDGARILGVGDDGAEDVFEALAAETTREVLAAVYEEPCTASGIADRVDTSLQNATYHLEKLQDADLITVGDTWYSEQGNEMKVYAPTRESVVLFAGEESARSTLREGLSRLLGAVGLLAVASLLVQRLLGDGTEGVRTTFDSGGPEYHANGTNVTENARSGTTPTPTDPESGVTLLQSADPGWLTPGALFFLGGVCVLLALVAWTLATRRRD